MKRVLSKFKINILNKNLNININNKEKNRRKNKKINKNINLNKISKKKSKKRYLCLSIFNIVLLVCFFMMLFNQTSFAFWCVPLAPNNFINQYTIIIGRWAYGVLLYDPDNKVNISAGTYVLRDMPDGTQRVFYCQNFVSATDQYNDPLNPVTGLLPLPKYLDCSGEYQKYHTYRRRDKPLVIFNNKIYQYDSNIIHTANTVSARSPAEAPTRWKLRSDLPLDTNEYFEYKSYIYGDIVTYNNSTFMCIANIIVDQEPKNNSPYWQSI